MKNFGIKLVLLFSFLVVGCASIHQEFEMAYPSSDLWTGEWKSEKVSRANGNIYTMIPKNLKNGQMLKVPVAISFSAFSPYYAGKTYVAEFKGLVSNNRITAYYKPNQKIDPKILNLSFSDGRYRPGERIRIVFNTQESKAEGFWESTDGEKGSFMLQKKGARGAIRK